jgi:hypothetical protein
MPGKPQSRSKRDAILAKQRKSPPDLKAERRIAAAAAKGSKTLKLIGLGGLLLKI